MGKAVLASDVGGHKELIEDGKTGLLFAADNVDDLVAQSVRLANDPTLRFRLGEAGRRFVVQERSWQKLISRYVGLYEEVLTEKS